MAIGGIKISLSKSVNKICKGFLLETDFFLQRPFKAPILEETALLNLPTLLFSSKITHSWRGKMDQSQQKVSFLRMLRCHSSHGNMLLA